VAALHVVTFEPAGWVPLTGPAPLLMIVAASDWCTFPDVQLDVFSTAREPKRIEVYQAGAPRGEPDPVSDPVTGDVLGERAVVDVAGVQSRQVPG
jgi:hypothetical protein